MKQNKKDIVIMSESGDLVTILVMDWIRYYNKTFTRTNFEDSVEKISILFENKIRFIKPNPNNDSVLWIRRGNYNVIFLESPHLELPISSLIPTFEKVERNTISQYLNQQIIPIEGKNIIGIPATAHPNKLQQLQAALENGLMIPPTLITTEKEQLLIFHKKYLQLISKSIQFQFFLFDTLKRTDYILYTGELKQDDIDALPNQFFPTLFQKKIEKKYELRIFYLKGKCYCSAIFSQNNLKTQIDYRKYDNQKPNRNVPYKLPIHVETSINLTMQNLQLNTGSIDMIVTPQNEYYFLEVNPSGQFGAISYRNNFYLEKKITEELINLL